MSLALALILLFFCVIAGVAILWPFFSARASGQASQFSEEKSALAARLQGIDGDVEAGHLEPAEADALRAEIARRFVSLKKDGADENSTAGHGSGGLVTAAASVLAVVALTLGLYSQVGSPHYPDQPVAARVEQVDRIEALIARVEDRLRTTPDDVQGWEVLAPVYMRTQQFEKAANAHGNLARLADTARAKSEHLADQSEAMFLQTQGRFQPASLAILRQALELDSDNPKAIYMNAIAIDQSGDIAKARENWARLAEKFEGTEPRIVAIAQQRLATLNEVTAAGPSQAQIQSAADMPSSDRREMIEGMVASLADRLEQNPDDLPGWERLIRSYMVLGQTQDAKNALTKAREILPDNALTRANLADVSARLDALLDAAENTN